MLRSIALLICWGFVVVVVWNTPCWHKPKWILYPVLSPTFWLRNTGYSHKTWQFDSSRNRLFPKWTLECPLCFSMFLTPHSTLNLTRYFSSISLSLKGYILLLFLYSYFLLCTHIYKESCSVPIPLKKLLFMFQLCPAQARDSHDVWCIREDRAKTSISWNYLWGHHSLLLG